MLPLVLWFGLCVVDKHIVVCVHVLFGDRLAGRPHRCPGLVSVVSSVTTVLPLPEDTGHGWRGETGGGKGRERRGGEGRERECYHCMCVSVSQLSMFTSRSVHRVLKRVVTVWEALAEGNIYQPMMSQQNGGRYKWTYMHTGTAGTEQQGFRNLCF